MPARQMLGEKPQASDLKKIFDETTKSGVISRGVVGSSDAPLYVKDEEAPPPLTADEETEARVLRGLLLKWIEPPHLSKESRPDQDKYSFTSKVNKQTLEDLRRFFNLELPDDLVGALRRKYQDISP